MKRTKYPIHPDFKKWSHMNPPLNRPFLALIQPLMGRLFQMEKSSAELTVERKTIPVGESGVRALLYTPKDMEDRSACLVYYHGGGFVLPAAPYHYALAREYALRARCRVLFVDYRLAPKHPFPTAPGDCFAAYTWALEHAEELSVDAYRVAVGGDSAGGELATVVCLMAKERGSIPPCGQMLMYPVTGTGIETESMKTYTDTPMCNSRDAEKYDKYYMRDPSAGKRVYASPIEAESLEALPPAYIETAEFDCLRDGGILYAGRLQSSGVPTELYNTKGTIHGFDIELSSPIVRDCVDRRVAFLKQVFTSGRKR